MKFCLACRPVGLSRSSSNTAAKRSTASVPRSLLSAARSGRPAGDRLAVDPGKAPLRRLSAGLRLNLHRGPAVEERTDAPPLQGPISGSLFGRRGSLPR